MRSVAHAMLWASALTGIFLAFGWPFVFGNDPASESFHVVAVGTMLALFASIVATLVAKR